MIEDVVILKCEDYSKKKVDYALKKVISLLKIDPSKYKNVLIKPNLLRIFKKNQEAITTHSQIISSTSKIFKKSTIGESSFMETREVMKKLLPSFRNIIVFEEQKNIVVTNSKNKILKEIILPEVLKDFDFIINLPKMKTHSLTGISCAIKNHYGFIPGEIKQSLHRLAIGKKKFSSLLVDVFQNIKSDLHIADAIISMEGEGPSAGERKLTQLILASKNAVALDIAAARIMGFNPRDLPIISECIARGLYGGYDINIIGDFIQIPELKFKRPITRNNFFLDLISSKLKKNIRVDKNKCIKCGICKLKCPKKCISLVPYPFIKSSKCINCYCCIEVCPYNALRAEPNLLWKLGKKIKVRLSKWKR